MIKDDVQKKRDRIKVLAELKYWRTMRKAATESIEYLMDELYQMQ